MGDSSEYGAQAGEGAYGMGGYDATGSNVSGVHRHGVYGMYEPNLSPGYGEGFNPLDDENIQYLLNNTRFGATLDILKDTFGIDEDKLNPVPLAAKIHDGDIIENQKGALGVFRVGRDPINDAKRLIKDINESIKNNKPVERIAQVNTFDEEEGMLSTDKLKNYRPSQGMELLNHPDDIAELVNQGSTYDAVYNAGVSWRLLAGIYGYMGGATVGLGVDDRKIVPTSQDMTSFSRKFWDSGIGGAGGDTHSGGVHAAGMLMALSVRAVRPHGMTRVRGTRPARDRAWGAVERRGP